MTDEKTKEFEPITTQEEFDERIKGRLAREKEKWEKQSGVEELKAELEQERADRRRADAERALRGELARRGVDDSRVERVMRLVDLDAVHGEEGVSREQVLRQVDSVASDIPELVRPRGAGSGGSRKPVFQQEPPLTREQIESMSVEEQRRPGMKERIDAFLQGER